MRLPTAFVLVNKSPCVFAFQCAFTRHRARLCDRLLLGEAALYSCFSDAFRFGRKKKHDWLMPWAHHASRRRIRARAPGGEKKHRPLLTVRKSLIRFRHSRPLLRKRVSKNKATTCNEKPNSTQAVEMVDAGVLSPSIKVVANIVLRMQPGPPAANRVFVCRAPPLKCSQPCGESPRWSGRRWSAQRSVPVHLRARRLAAGSNPRRCFVLGCKPR